MVNCSKIDKVLNVAAPYLKSWPQKGKEMEEKCYREVSDALARRLEPLREAQFPVAVKRSRSGL